MPDGELAIDLVSRQGSAPGDAAHAIASEITILYVPNGANWPGRSYDPETGILKVSPFRGPAGPAAPEEARAASGRS